MSAIKTCDKSNGKYYGTLLPEHLADLRRSGLNDSTVHACRFTSITSSKEINSALGWDVPQDIGPCLQIPFIDASGRDTGYCRLKPDNPRKDFDGKLHKYEAPLKVGSRLYIPPGCTRAAIRSLRDALVITEGEKKAARADQEGVPCVGLSGVWNWGKSNQLIEDLACISWQGRHVYIVFDSDGATNDNVQLAAKRLAEVLEKLGATARTIFLPGGPQGKVGLDDYLCTHTVDDLKKLLAGAAAQTVPEEPAPSWEPPPWPAPPGDEAFHGLAGRIVRTIEPASEADPVGLLVQVLVMFGNAIGRSPHFRVEADRHGANESTVQVGRTSKAQKGTSYGHGESALRHADEYWVANRVQTGASNGEGIIWAIRDPVRKRERIKERGKPVKYEEVEVDPGVADKRLLIYEPEFANVLKQTERQGNTLSAVLRQAWDGRDLATLTKNSPARASNPHVSLIGHITVAELRRYLTETEAANGYGNRHLWVCVNRSKQLPEGGQLDQLAWKDCTGELASVVTFARTAGEVFRDDDARAIWREIYGELSEGKPGLAGALLARGEAHVMRLAMLYALLDRSLVISPPHLLAALALWEFCERSVYYLFGDALGDPLADEILR
jgi:hypothetical protein